MQRAVLRILALALACCAGGYAHAQIYKWVDEKGVTQYGSSPPPGKGQKVIDTPTAGASNKVDAKNKPLSVKEQEIDFRVRRAEAEEKQRKEEEAHIAAQRQAAERRESCIKARRDLQAMTEQRPIYSLNERGERVYLDDKDRPQAIENAKYIIARDCPA
jgi:Domain of unknown function (DUF4124)